MSERVFILAGSRALGVAWCRANRVAPNARTTFILSTPGAARGIALRSEDRVVTAETRDQPVAPQLLREWQYVELSATP